MKRLAAWTVLAVALTASNGALADAASEAALLERLEQQEQRIKVLERKLEIQDEAAKTAVTSTPVVKASPKGFSLQSADGRTGATATISNGERIRCSPQFYYYLGGFGLLGEYVQVSTEVSRTTTAGTSTGRINNNGWQLAASWFLTGEEATYRGYTPLTTFSPGKSWGAFELNARYHELDIDDEAFVGGANSFADPAASATKASTAEVGFNWYLNQNLKWVLNYGITRFEGGVATGDRDDEMFLLTRFALGF